MKLEIKRERPLKCTWDKKGEGGERWLHFFFAIILN